MRTEFSVSLRVIESIDIGIGDFSLVGQVCDADK